MANVGKIWFVVDPHLYHITPSSRRDDYGQTCLSKLRHVVGQVGLRDILVFSGDVFHQPHVADWFVIEVERILLPLKGRVFTIYGNHDFPQSNKLKKDDCALTLLTVSGIIEHLEEPRDFGPVRLYGFDYDQSYSHPDPGVFAVWVVHKFVDTAQGLSETEVLTAEEIAEYKPRVILAGHDHQVYPEAKIGGSLVIRPGSMTRGTKHNYNRVRDVYMACIDVGGGGQISYHRIPAQSPEEIFIEESVVRERIERNLDDFIELLRRNRGKYKTNLGDLVAEMNLPEGVQAKLEVYLHQANIMLHRREELRLSTTVA